MDQEKPIQYHLSPQGVAVLRINRPRSRNALNWEAQELFAAAVSAMHQEPQLRAVIITGSGDQTFVSGGDLKEHLQDHGPQAGARLNQVMTAALADLRALPVAVIAAVNGDAFGGGCEILTACDLRLARSGARFGFAQVRTGLTSGWGGGARLVELVGASRACELLMSGRIFTAQEALQIGFLHRLTAEGEDVLAAAYAWAADLMQLPADALAANKQLVYTASSLPAAEVAEFEAAQFLRCWGSDNHVEALTAFSEKRPPRFNLEDKA